MTGITNRDQISRWNVWANLST